MPDHSLPLVELHRHLDGNIKARRIWQLMQKHQLQGTYASLHDVERALHMQGQAQDLMDFLKKLDLGVSVLTDYDAIRAVATDNVEDAFTEGLDYVELRFSPMYMAQPHRLSLTSVIEAIWDGIAEGMRLYPVQVNLIGILSRTNGVQVCEAELEALLHYPQYFVALDLAGDEKNAPARWFVDHFAKAREAGWQATVHAGEADGAQSIRDAVNLLQASRIGHGVRAIDDPDLMDMLLEKDVAIESCPTSNLHTSTISRWSEHPLKAFVEKGLKVTLNTDDPGVSDITIGNEYRIARNKLGLTAQQLRQVQLNGVHAAFLPDQQKRALLNKKKP